MPKDQHSPDEEETPATTPDDEAEIPDEALDIVTGGTSNLVLDGSVNSNIVL